MVKTDRDSSSNVNGCCSTVRGRKRRRREKEEEEEKERREDDGLQLEKKIFRGETQMKKFKETGTKDDFTSKYVCFFFSFFF